MYPATNARNTCRPWLHPKIMLAQKSAISGNATSILSVAFSFSLKGVQTLLAAGLSIPIPLPHYRSGVTEGGGANSLTLFGEGVAPHDRIAACPCFPRYQFDPMMDLT